VTQNKIEPKEDLWTDRVDPHTGEHSLKTHELKTVKVWCKDHNLQVTNMKKRLAECTSCGQEVTFVVGRDLIKDDGSVIVR
jgi:hypothetical protein